MWLRCLSAFGGAPAVATTGWGTGSFVLAREEATILGLDFELLTTPFGVFSEAERRPPR